MKVLNATPWEIEAGFNGNKFFIKSDEPLEIWDINVIRHLCKSRGYQGVVHLIWGDEQKKKYKSEKEFYRHQVLESLTLCRRWKEEALRNEIQATRDLSKKNGTEYDKTTMNPKKFEAMLKEIDDKVESLKAKWKKEDDKELPSKEVENESNDDDNKSSGEVRRSKRSVLV